MIHQFHSGKKIQMTYKTDLTPIHHPHEYELLAPEGHSIFIGTKEQCEERLRIICAMQEQVGLRHAKDPDYGSKCSIRKV